MKQKKLSLIFTLFLLLSCLVSCGGDESSSGIVGENAAPTGLVKTASLVYNDVDPDYDNIIIYKSGSSMGVLNNDGTVRIQAQYPYVGILDEDHLVFRDASGQSGLMDLNGEVLVSGNYNISGLGAGYCLFETVKSIEGDNGIVESVECTYALYSLKEKDVIPCPIFDKIINVGRYAIFTDTSYATETNLLLQCIDSKTFESVEYAFYWENQKIITVDQCYKDGCAKKDGQLYNAKGEPIENCNHSDNTDQTVEKRDGYYGVVDSSGKEIIPFQYDEIAEYAAGIYAVQMNKSWGFIDKTGKVLMNPTINDDYSAEYRCFITKDTEKSCLYNPYSGARTVYDFLMPLDTKIGTYRADTGDGKGIVTFEKALTEFAFDEVSVSKDGKVYVAQKGSTYDVYVWQ